MMREHERAIDILVLSEINPDLVLHGTSVEPVFGQVEKLVDGADLTIGGSGTIFACGSARLGLATSVSGLVGDDAFGRFMIDQLSARGVDVDGVVISASATTGLTVILNRGEDRAILTHTGAMAGMTTDLVDPSLLRRARHVHISSYFIQIGLHTGLPGLLREFRSHGGTVSLDTNWDPNERWQAGVHELLAEVDILMPNEAEACALAGVDDAGRAAAILTRQGPDVVVKCGARGAFLQSGDIHLSTGSIAVDVVDSTGAGDSFDAGYLYGTLGGLDPLECLRLAAVCGALSTRAMGGTIAQPTLEEARTAAGALT